MSVKFGTVIVDPIEQIEELKDELHDARQDIKRLEQENNNLEKEIKDLEKDAALHTDEINAIEEDQVQREQEHAHALTISYNEFNRMRDDSRELSRELEVLRDRFQETHHNYIKALSIAETLKTNRGAGYFDSPQGRDLINWACSELRNESNKIMRG
jgi:chromosome segregation ATPase